MKGQVVESYLNYTTDTHFQLNREARTSTTKGLLELGFSTNILPHVSFNANAFIIHGQSISKSFGDAFFVSSIDGRNTARLQNFWLEYMPNKSFWSFRIGKQAFDDEFLVTPNSDLFISGAGAFVFTLPVSSPQWPIATPAFLASFHKEKTTFKAAVYLSDEHLTDESINTSGLDFSLKTAGALAITEYSQSLDLIDFRIGLFHDSNKTRNLKTGQESNTSAFYIIAEPKLFENKEHSITGHLAYSRVFNTSTATIDYDIRVAALYNTLVNNKKVRVGAGFFFPHVGEAVTDQYGSAIGSEHFTELTLEFQATQRLFFRTAFQHVLNPGAPFGVSLPNGSFLVGRVAFSL